MSMRLVYAGLFTLSAAGWLVPVGLAGQIPIQETGDTLTLVIEREVFAYPQYDRRNPFRTLLSADGGGPRLENLLLLGILYSPFPGESIALFGEGTRALTPAAAQIRLFGEKLASISESSFDSILIWLKLGFAESRENPAQSTRRRFSHSLGRYR